MGRLGPSQLDVTHPGTIRGSGPTRLLQDVPAPSLDIVLTWRTSGVSTCLVQGDGIPSLSTAKSGRTHPASSGRSSSKSRHSADSKDLRGASTCLVQGNRIPALSTVFQENGFPAAQQSSRATESRPSQQSARATVDHRSLPSQLHSRQHDGDSTDIPGCLHVSGKEMDMTSTVTKQTERRIITGIQSSVQPASLDDSAGSVDPARCANSAGVDDSARVADPARCADSARAADSAKVTDSAKEAIPAAVDTTGSYTPALQGTAWEDGSLLFPSLARQINQAGVLDFSSMMIIIQRRFRGTLAPETIATPPLDASTIPAQRRLIDLSPSPYRDNDTTKSPVRSSWTPVRRCRNLVDSPRINTRCGSQLWTSSSSESPARDGSPVDFKAALDPGEIGRSPTVRMRMVPVGSFLQLSTRSSLRQWLPPRGHSSSTRPSPGELPGPLCWILATVSWLTVFPGWTNHLWQTPWRPQPGLLRDWRRTNRCRRQRCLSPLMWSLHRWRQDLRTILIFNCYCRTRYFRTLDASLKFWIRCGLLPLRSPTSWVRSPRFSNSGCGPSGRWIVWLGLLWLHPEDQGLSTVQHEEDCFCQEEPASQSFSTRALGFCEDIYYSVLSCRCQWGSHHRPIPTQHRKARGAAQLPQPTATDRLQVGTRLADFVPQWPSFLGTCRSTNTVEEGVGLASVLLPQLTHQCITFRSRSSRQGLQQAVDALLSMGAIVRVINETSLRFYSRLFLVPKKTGDLRPVIDLSTLNQHMVVPHFKMKTQGSVKAAIRSQEWKVSIDIRDAYLHVPMHRAVRKYLHFVVNKRIYPFTWLPLDLATSHWVSQSYWDQS